MEGLTWISAATSNINKRVIKNILKMAELQLEANLVWAEKGQSFMNKMYCEMEILQSKIKETCKLSREIAAHIKNPEQQEFVLQKISSKASGTRNQFKELSWDREIYMEAFQQQILLNTQMRSSIHSAMTEIEVSLEKELSQAYKASGKLSTPRETYFPQCFILRWSTMNLICYMIYTP